MKATLTYEGKTVEVEIAEEEVRKIFEKPKTGWERVEPGQCYCYITGGGFVPQETEKQNESDTFYYNNANYFADRDLANDQARAISLWLRIKRWAAEHCEPVDWEDQNSHKYFISYNRTLNEICYDGNFVFQGVFQIYFDTEEHINQCIDEFQDDLLWYFTECKDRVDN